MASDEITIYAELLANLRQISVVASLPSAAGPGTAARILAGSSTIKISHGSSAQGLELPGHVGVSGVLPTNQPASSELTWRIPLAPSHAVAAPFRPEDQDVPWTSLDLAAGTEVSCRGCGTVIVAEEVLKVWKDLPSENWAEMMEFWHCHKPVRHGGDGHGHDKNASSKGYGANTSPSAQPGVGFVDVTTLTLDRSDCTGLDYGFLPSGGERPGKTETTLIFCRGCKSELGYVLGISESLCLLKWQVRCSTSRETSRPPELPEFLAASLLAAMSRSGSSKSVVMPRHQAAGVDHGTILHLWILNTNVLHASTATRQVRTSIKLLFKVVGQDEADKLLDSMTSGVQEVNMPQEAIGVCLQSLRQTNAVLPKGERQFRGWDVGLLRRWERA